MCMPKICLLCEENALEKLCQAPSPKGPRLYWHCQMCDLVFLDPSQRLNDQEEKDQYDLHHNQIEDEAYCQFLGRLIEPLLSAFTTESFDQLLGLDFGCGPEPVLAELLGQRGIAMAAYDPLFSNDPTILEKTYDMITCSEVVEHVYQPLTVWRQLDQLLNPGGTLGVMTGMLPSWEGFADWHYRRELTHVCFYSLKTMDWVAETFGWSMTLSSKNVVIFRK